MPVLVTPYYPEPSCPGHRSPRHWSPGRGRAGRRAGLVLLRAAAAALVALGLAACGSSEKPPTAERPTVDNRPLTGPSDLDPDGVGPGVPVKVALLLPLSGKFSDLGKAMQQAAEMAVFETKSRNLQLLPLDTGGTREGAAAAADRAVAQGVKLIVGPLFAEAVEGVRPVAQGANLNVIAFSNTPSVAGGNVFLLSFLVKQQVDRIVEYAAQQDRRRIAVLAPDDSSGRHIVDYARAAAADHGATITRTGFFSGNITTMQEQVKAFTGASGVTRKGVALRSRPLDFTALLIHAGGAPLRTMSSLLAFYDVDPDKVQFLGTGRWDHPSTRSEASLKGGWFAAPPPDLRDRFTARYEQAYESRPPRIASLAYDAVALAAVLARSARSEEDNPYTAEAITNPNGFLGVDGIFRFTRDGLSERGLAVLEVTPEEFRVIGPAPTSFAPTPPPVSERGPLQPSRKASIASRR